MLQTIQNVPSCEFDLNLWIESKQKEMALFHLQNQKLSQSPMNPAHEIEQNQYRNAQEQAWVDNC